MVSTQLQVKDWNGGRLDSHVVGPFPDRNAARRFADKFVKDGQAKAAKLDPLWGADVLNASVVQVQAL